MGATICAKRTHTARSGSRRTRTMTRARATRARTTASTGATTSVMTAAMDPRSTFVSMALIARIAATEAPCPPLRPRQHTRHTSLQTQRTRTRHTLGRTRRSTARKSCAVSSRARRGLRVTCGRTRRGAPKRTLVSCAVLLKGALERSPRGFTEPRSTLACAAIFCGAPKEFCQESSFFVLLCFFFAVLTWTSAFAHAIISRRAQREVMRVHTAFPAPLPTQGIGPGQMGGTEMMAITGTAAAAVLVQGDAIPTAMPVLVATGMVPVAGDSTMQPHANAGPSIAVQGMPQPVASGGCD